MENANLLDKFLHRTCLRPTYLLRQQLMLCFGITSLLTVATVVIAACFFAIGVRSVFDSRSAELIQEQLINRTIYNNRFIAKTVDSYMDGWEGSVQIIVEVVQDRIVGYPLHGWEEDKYVPFQDMETLTNKYPLNSKPLPLDWDFQSNINSTNAWEHLQERETSLLQTFPNLSTAHGIYFMQGACDPKESNPMAPTYYPNCTTENNNMVTGGVIQPTKNNLGLYKKSADIAIVLKPIFESHPNIASIDVSFANSGAGSYVVFPAMVRNFSSAPLISAGCDWMREMNPFTNNPFGTEEEIARCHPMGTLVSQREYNVLERSWFQSFALNPSQIRWFGPFNYSDGLVSGVAVGRSLFDRITGHFIGCVRIRITLDELTKLLRDSRVYNDSAMVIVRCNDSSVFGDTLNTSPGYEPISVTETNLISEKYYKELRDCVHNTVNSGSLNPDCYIIDNDLMYTANGIQWKNTIHEHLIPDFLLIHKVYFDNKLNVSKTVHSQINDQILRIIFLSTIVGSAGVFFVLFIVWLVAGKLTKPLIWMEHVSSEIVSKTGVMDLKLLNREVEPSNNRTWIPFTEIDSLVKEFRLLILGFSGDGASRVAHPCIREIRNDLTWQSNFFHLYTAPNDFGAGKQSQILLGNVKGSGTAKQDESFELIPNVVKEGMLPDTTHSNNLDGNAWSKHLNLDPVVHALPKCNLNKNILSPVLEFGSEKSSTDYVINIDKVNTIKSSLFWWLLMLIVIPLLFTIAVICIIVSIKTMNAVPSLMDVVKDHSQELESLTLHSITLLKAEEAKRSFTSVVRDLHLITRFAGWLFFNGVNRSESFTFVEETAEECKSFSNTCPILKDTDKFPCSCDWKDLSGIPCANYSSNNTRPMQNLFVSAEARDFDPSTGNRTFVKPKPNDSPGKTKWWNNASEMPGAEKRKQASGFETSYDRVRVSSAMGVVEIPLYNYATQIKRSKYLVSTLIGFEADGMTTGYTGCRRVLTSQFQSTIENVSTDVNRDICPVGKYGYDPRCRDWYASGKYAYFEDKVPVMVAAQFKTIHDNFAAVVSSPIANPSITSSSYVGQSALVFSPSFIGELLKDVKELSFLITPEKSQAINDTIVRPDNKDIEWETGNILDFLFWLDESNSAYRELFYRDILSKMKSGESGTGTFERTNTDGLVEKFSLFYEPVYARVLLPLQADDFARGVKVSTILVYSLAIAYQEAAIKDPWDVISSDVERDVQRLRVIYYLIVGIVSFLFVLLACYSSVRVTRPMISLLRVVEEINGRKDSKGIPPIQGGSREVLQAYNSFSKSFKIIRGSNVAFFSGNLAWAYDFISEALKLFRKVGDEKAIGIACSNVGNAIYTMCYIDSKLNERRRIANFGFLTKTALQHYDEAIEVTESQLKQANNERTKVDLNQQLSDRLFNRALLLCLMYAEGDADLRETALNDIKRVQELDSKVVSFRLHQKILREKLSEHFYRLLQRCLGLVENYEILKEIWDPHAVATEADQLLFASWDAPSSPLFEEVSRIGRLQQLESVVIQIKLRKGKKFDAARLAIRMIVEDEYLIEDAFRSASTALMSLFRDPDEWRLPQALTSQTRVTFDSDLRRMLRSCRQISLNIEKCFLFAFEINKVWKGHDLLEKLNKNCLCLFDDYCTQDDYVGIAAYTGDGNNNVPLVMKSENESQQRSAIDLATKSICEVTCSSIPSMIQILTDSSAATENDSFILLVTDGYSWDSTKGDFLLQKIEKLNIESKTKIHVIILGMELAVEKVLIQCENICRTSSLSKYMGIWSDNIDSVFESIKKKLTGVGNAAHQHGIIMEKF